MTRNVFAVTPAKLLDMLDVLQAKVSHRLLKSAGITFDKYETKEI